MYQISLKTTCIFYFSQSWYCHLSVDCFCNNNVYSAVVVVIQAHIKLTRPSQYNIKNQLMLTILHKCLLEQDSARYTRSDIHLKMRNKLNLLEFYRKTFLYHTTHLLIYCLLGLKHTHVKVGEMNFSSGTNINSMFSKMQTPSSQQPIFFCIGLTPKQKKHKTPLVDPEVDLSTGLLLKHEFAASLCSNRGLDLKCSNF